MENIALARLRQAANKTSKTGDSRENNGVGVMPSNLVSLTGSPAGKGDKDRRMSGGSRSRHAGSDMDMSEDEDGEIRDNFLEEGFPPPQREQRDAWQAERGEGWENGGDVSAESDYDHHQGPLPGIPPEGNGHFTGPPPRFPPPQPGFNTPQDSPARFPPPNIHHGPPPRPPPPFRPPGPLMDQPDSLLASGDQEHSRSLPPNNFGPRFDGPESHRGGHRGGFDGPRPHRGSFDDHRGGFGSRGGFDGPNRFPGPPPHRFNSPRGRGGFPSERFDSPVNNFSDNGPGPGNGLPGPGRGDSPGDRFDSDRGGFDSPRGRGGFRGGGFKGGFDGPSDFDGNRGGFDGRGRGGRGGWNGARRPWGNPRGRRGRW